MDGSRSRGHPGGPRTGRWTLTRAVAPNCTATPGLAALDGERVDRDHAELWARIVDTRNPQLREKLIVLYAPLVKHVPARVTRCCRGTDRAALLSFGAFGLTHAVDRFDPTAGVKFETYAAPRIRGAIIDELRDLDGPRAVSEPGPKRSVRCTRRSTPSTAPRPAPNSPSGWT